jgi:hypothetical protein
MTTPAPETTEREQGKLYLSDAENKYRLARSLGESGPCVGIPETSNQEYI